MNIVSSQVPFDKLNTPQTPGPKSKKTEVHKSFQK